MTRSIWRVMCQTHHHPGQWQVWLREQCCAVGWHPRRWRDAFDEQEFWSFDPDVSSPSKEWAKIRNHLRAMKPGDLIVAMLPNARVGRVGEVVRLEVEDRQWRPIVRPTKNARFGENGRRIAVRWDLSLGPTDFDQVVQLPAGLRSFGQSAVSRLDERRYRDIEAAMRESKNWEGFYKRFASEKALSDYIAAHPQRLGGDLRICRNVASFRELSLSDGGRIDVVLEDSNETPVLVECKQGVLVQGHINQLCGYLRQFSLDFPHLPQPRGILVCGGGRRLDHALRVQAEQNNIDLVYHELRVDFFTLD